MDLYNRTIRACTLGNRGLLNGVKEEMQLRRSSYEIVPHGVRRERGKQKRDRKKSGNRYREDERLFTKSLRKPCHEKS